LAGRAGAPAGWVMGGRIAEPLFGFGAAVVRPQ
jgi:hypothetical protein